MARKSSQSDRMDYRRILGFFGVVASAAGLGFSRDESPDPQFPPLRVDPNVAPREVLAALPMLGPARVAAIEAARKVTPFKSVDDLDRHVKGIGPATIDALKPFLRFDTTPASHP